MIRRLASELTRKRAKDLRKAPPHSEAALWQLVRRKRIAGFKFHRRAVVLGSIPDFWCPAAKLALEIDDTPSDWKTIVMRRGIRDSRPKGLGRYTFRRDASLMNRNNSSANWLR